MVFNIFTLTIVIAFCKMLESVETVTLENFIRSTFYTFETLRVIFFIHLSRATKLSMESGMDALYNNQISFYKRDNGELC